MPQRPGIVSDAVSKAHNGFAFLAHGVNEFVICRTPIPAYSKSREEPIQEVEGRIPMHQGLSSILLLLVVARTKHPHQGKFDEADEV